MVEISEESPNIAETSLTIDGVTTVIDSGLARIAHHDPQRGFDRLDLARISQASATQRAGRAGRTGPGRCLRLWSEREQRMLAPFEIAEVHRVDLCAAVLALHSWGVRDACKFAGVQKGHSYYWSQDRCSGQLPMITYPVWLEDGGCRPRGRRLYARPKRPAVFAVHESVP